MRRAFSARSEFPSEWNAFLRPAEGSSQAVLSVELAEQLFPHLAQGADLTITNLELIALVKDPDGWQSTTITVTAPNNGETVPLIGSPVLYGGRPRASVAYATGAAPGRWDVSVPIDQLGAPAEWADDMILIATYQVALDLE